MANEKYLDYGGLQELVSQIKTKVRNKIEVTTLANLTQIQLNSLQAGDAVIEKDSTNAKDFFYFVGNVTATKLYLINLSNDDLTANNTLLVIKEYTKASDTWSMTSQFNTRLQSKIYELNKLNADYVQNGATNVVVSTTDQANWNGKVDASKTAGSETGTITNNGSKIRLQHGDSASTPTWKSYLDLDGDVLELGAYDTNGAYVRLSLETVDTDGESHYTGRIRIITDNKDIELLDKLTFDDAVRNGSSKAVQSGAVYDVMQNITAIAEGKTSNYVISDAQVSGYENDSFASTNTTITITSIGGKKIKDVNNNDILLSSMKIGDIVSVVETNVPDRWVGSITSTNDGTTMVFYPLETKLNVDQTWNASTSPSSTNPQSGSAVAQAMATKQDTMTAITTAEVDALF